MKFPSMRYSEYMSYLKNSGVDNSEGKVTLESTNHTSPLKAKDEDPCLLCEAPIQDSELIAVMPCHPQHYFHSDCVQAWFTKNDVCPRCKLEIINLSFNTVV